jgi:hypothetical protein
VVPADSNASRNNDISATDPECRNNPYAIVSACESERERERERERESERERERER